MNIGALHVLRRLRQGGGVEVRQAAAEGSQVAVKLARDAGPHPGLEREQRTLELLSGPPAPRLVDAGAWEGRRYLVLEWCVGVGAATAARQLREAGSRTSLLALCVALARAYEALHARGVLHGQVHPAHVLVDRDGQVRILDFTLASIDGGPTAPRGPVGTLLEPEFLGLDGAGPPRPLTARGEQYAVAALLYLLLTGRLSCDFAKQRAQVLRQIREQPPLPFAERGAAPWPDVEAALAVALRKDPAQRFPSLGALAEALEAARPAAAPSVVSADALQRKLDAFLEVTAGGGPLLAEGCGAAPRCSVNFGAAGIAFALGRLASARSQPELLELADAWIARAERDRSEPGAFFTDPAVGLTPESVGRVSPYHTASGVHLVRALIAGAQGREEGWSRAVDAYVRTSSGPFAHEDLTLGRASVLLGCALLHADASGRGTVAPPELSGHGDRMLDELWRGGDHAMDGYLGIAHGWAGRLYASLRWCEAQGVGLPAAAGDRLAWLAAQAVPIGRGLCWPVELGGSHDVYEAELVPWVRRLRVPVDGGASRAGR